MSMERVAGWHLIAGDASVHLWWKRQKHARTVGSKRKRCNGRGASKVERDLKRNGPTPGLGAEGPKRMWMPDRRGEDGLPRRRNPRHGVRSRAFQEAANAQWAIVAEKATSQRMEADCGGPIPMPVMPNNVHEGMTEPK